MDITRIMIVEDHDLTRKNLSDMFIHEPDMAVIALIDNGWEAINTATSLQPDVIIMDYKLEKHENDINGIEATRQITLNNPHVAVLMLTSFHEDREIFAAMCAGARGYLVKRVSRNDLLRAIRDVANGAVIFSPKVAERMRDYFANIRFPDLKDFFPKLSSREAEVLELMIAGLRNKEIGEPLGIEEKTVRNHISNIIAKLQFGSRAEAIAKAKELTKKSGDVCPTCGRKFEE